MKKYILLVCVLALTACHREKTVVMESMVKTELTVRMDKTEEMVKMVKQSISKLKNILHNGQACFEYKEVFENAILA